MPTVREVIAELNKFPPDANVIAIASSNGEILEFAIIASEDPPEDGSSEVWIALDA